MRLSRVSLLAFISQALPVAGLGLPIVVYLPPFYADEMGLGLAAVGWIFMITRFFDVAIDPVFGLLADRYGTRFGRRKPWIALALPILMLSVWMIFAPAGTVGGTYLLFWLLAMYVGWTFATISILAWSAELATDYDARTRVQGAYQAALMVGLITVLIIPAAYELMGAPALRDKMRGVGWFIVVLLPITFIAALAWVPETKVSERAEVHWRDMVGALVGSRPLRRLLAADLLVGLSSGVSGSLIVFIARDAFALGDRSGVLMLAYFVAGCLAIPFWVWLSKRAEKHTALIWAQLYSLVLLPVFLVAPPGNFWAALAMIALFGLPYASHRFLMKAMMADITDDDQVRTGRMQAGVYFGLLAMTEKIGLALAVGITYPLLEWIGFRTGTRNDEAALHGLVLLFVLLPAVLHVLAALVLWRFPLGRAAQRDLRRRIEGDSLSAREAGGEGGAHREAMGG
ncbi:MFS transporter [Vineibacter terrae]|uniref:MFS transporter n=1 Tax=Vineibacter terrae TaxID=2586908 RepID=UPI002E2EFFB6|nr:MFS transporter [Vineibacter terrae]HEX2891702.1 MFS transporter [Vineibacter terrae]